MDWLFRYQKQVVEPSGACALAALLTGQVRPVGTRVGVILSGGNISPERFIELLKSRDEH
jgi:threonine dehydratase